MKFKKFTIFPVGEFLCPFGYVILRSMSPTSSASKTTLFGMRLFRAFAVSVFPTPNGSLIMTIIGNFLSSPGYSAIIVWKHSDTRKPLHCQSKNRLKKNIDTAKQLRYQKHHISGILEENVKNDRYLLWQCITILSVNKISCCSAHLPIGIPFVIQD